MSEPERWVNAVIRIIIPLDGVTVTDSPSAKQDAVADIHTELVDGLPDSFSECVSSGVWEDVADDE